MTLPEDDEKPLNGNQQSPELPENPSDFQEADETTSPALSDEDLLRFSTPEEAAPDFEFPHMEDDVEAFRRELDALQYSPQGNTPPEEPTITDPVTRRRRRNSRVTERLNTSDIGERLDSMIQRSSPTVDFFVFALLCGCILGIGYLLDAPAILLIGIFVGPLLAPWVGTALAAATGEVRLFRQTFGGMLTGLVMVFVIGILAGMASRIFQPLNTSQALLHARLWWPDLLMLMIGTIILVISFIQTEDKPIIPSMMVAYELFLPVSAAGFGLGSGIRGLWPEAGLVFLIHLALSLIISLVIFFYMGFRPLETSGYALMAGIVVIGLVILAGFAGLGSLINVRGDQIPSSITALPTSTDLAPATSKPQSPATVKPVLAPSATPSRTPPPPPSPTKPQNTPTIEVTSGPTLLPTPVYGRVQSESGGVMVRLQPGGTSITTVENGYLVEILGEMPVIVDGAAWVHVLVKTPIRDIDGWVLLNLIVTATPSFSP